MLAERVDGFDQMNWTHDMKLKHVFAVVFILWLLTLSRARRVEPSVGPPSNGVVKRGQNHDEYYFRIKEDLKILQRMS